MPDCLALNIVGTSLSVTNRAGPIDPKSRTPLIGKTAATPKRAIVGDEDMTIYQKKERTGFGGGFKIPEDYRTKKRARNNRK